MNELIGHKRNERVASWEKNECEGDGYDHEDNVRTRDESHLNESDFEKENHLKGLHVKVKEITALAGIEINEDVREVLVELVQLNVVPTAIAQVLKSLCNKAKTTKSN